MDFLVISTACNTQLVDHTLAHLHRIPGFRNCQRAQVDIHFFRDGEPFVEILDNVRERECILFACLCKNEHGSINDHTMVLFTLLDALWRANAKLKTMIVPYLPYARQDRRRGQQSHRTAITAQLFPKLLHNAAQGLRHACIVEPHDIRVEGFSQFPVDIIPVLHLFAEPINRIFPDKERVVVCSPDQGGRSRASALANRILSPLPVASIEKRRVQIGKAEAVQLVGTVRDCDVVIVDDMVDSAGSLEESVRILKENGARRIIACCVHGIFSDPALERISNIDLECVIATSTIEHRTEVLNHPKIQIISVAELLAKVIQRIPTPDAIGDIGKTEAPLP